MFFEFGISNYNFNFDPFLDTDHRFSAIQSYSKENIKQLKRRLIRVGNPQQPSFKKYLAITHTQST